LLFYHIPKTGGVWVRETMRLMGYELTLVHSDSEKRLLGLTVKHAHPSSVYENQKEGKFTFAFVRHPLSWYRSFWAFRSWKNNEGIQMPAEGVWDDDFCQFVNNVLDVYPGGFLTYFYGLYVGEDGKLLDFVGKQECLAVDLGRALRLAGIEFDDTVLYETMTWNVSDRGRKRQAQYDAETKARVLTCEQWVVETFYND
jgi:hypothetical protein